MAHVKGSRSYMNALIMVKAVIPIAPGLLEYANSLQNTGKIEIGRPLPSGLGRGRDLVLDSS